MRLAVSLLLLIPHIPNSTGPPHNATQLFGQSEESVGFVPGYYSFSQSGSNSRQLPTSNIPIVIFPIRRTKSLLTEH